MGTCTGWGAGATMGADTCGTIVWGIETIGPANTAGATVVVPQGAPRRNQFRQRRPQPVLGTVTAINTNRIRNFLMTRFSAGSTRDGLKGGQFCPAQACGAGGQTTLQHPQ